MKKRYKVLIGVVAVVLILLVCIFCYIFFAKQSIQTVEAGDGADWMGRVDGSKSLSSINLPGSHDSCAWNSDFAWFSQCQSSDITSQLNMGIRYMDIRISLNSDQTGLVMTHSIAVCREGSRPLGKKLTFDKVLADCYDFLAAHPTETVVFCVKPEDEQTACKALLMDAIAQAQERWYTENVIPDLDTVRGKIVLASRFADAGAPGEGLKFLWEEQDNRDPLSDPFSVSAIDDDTDLYVQDRYCYDTEDKWTAITNGFDEKAGSVALDDNVMLQFLSTKGTGKLGHPYKYAREINERMLKKQLSNGSSYGWVIMDFAVPELVAHIYETNFSAIHSAAHAEKWSGLK